MATAPEATRVICKSRVIIHGNIGYKSAELLYQMKIHEQNNEYETEEYSYFPFSDLSPSRKHPIFTPHTEIGKLVEKSAIGIGVEVSGILLLISLTEIFSDGMHGLITKLPSSQFYGFNRANEKKWWDHVIIVFSFGEDTTRNHEHVQKTILGNKGLTDIVQKAGNKYIWISDDTTAGEIRYKLENKLLSLDGKLVFRKLYMPGYEEIVQSFLQNTAKPGGGKKEKHPRIILFGDPESETNCLANLLLNKPLFKSNDKVKSSQIEEVEVKEKIPGEKIQIMVEPENVKPKQFGEFLFRCVSELRNSSQVIFLIIIDLYSGSVAQKDCIKIKDVAEILANRNIDFFSNSLMVFTRVDEFDDHSEDNLHKILDSKLQEQEHYYLKRMLELVGQRYILVNAVNFSSRNRKELLRSILQFCITQENDDQNDKIDVIQKIVETVTELSVKFNNPIDIIFNTPGLNQKNKEILKHAEALSNSILVHQNTSDNSWNYTCFVIQNLNYECQRKSDGRKNHTNLDSFNYPPTDDIGIEIVKAIKRLNVEPRSSIRIISKETEKELVEEISRGLSQFEKANLQNKGKNTQNYFSYTCIIIKREASVNSDYFKTKANPVDLIKDENDSKNVVGKTSGKKKGMKITFKRVHSL